MSYIIYAVAFTLFTTEGKIGLITLGTLSYQSLATYFLIVLKIVSKLTRAVWMEAGQPAIRTRFPRSETLQQQDIL